MRIFLSSTILIYLYTSTCFATKSDLLELFPDPRVVQTQKVQVIDDDYDPSREKPIETDKLAVANITAMVDNDYVNEAKDIKVHSTVPKPPEGYLKKTGRVLGSGLYMVGEHTLRITLGCLSNHLFDKGAAILFSQAIYAVTFYFTGNPFIANFMYATAAKTCQPIVAALVFYTGAKSPDIVYYTGKSIIKAVQITGDTGILLVRAAKIGARAIAKVLVKKEIRDRMIEMSVLNHPNFLSLKE